jgi:hypothetical protein
MPPIKLTDDELTAVLAAAKPIAIDRRDDFLQAVANELSRYAELGPGIVHRVIVQVQRDFFDPPHLERSGVWSKYA